MGSYFCGSGQALSTAQVTEEKKNSQPFPSSRNKKLSLPDSTSERTLKLNSPTSSYFCGSPQALSTVQVTEEKKNSQPFPSSRNKKLSLPDSTRERTLKLNSPTSSYFCGSPQALSTVQMTEEKKNSQPFPSSRNKKLSLPDSTSERTLKLNSPTSSYFCGSPQALSTVQVTEEKKNSQPFPSSRNKKLSLPDSTRERTLKLNSPTSSYFCGSPQALSTAQVTEEKKNSQPFPSSRNKKLSLPDSTSERTLKLNSPTSSYFCGSPQALSTAQVTEEKKNSQPFPSSRNKKLSLPDSTRERTLKLNSPTSPYFCGSPQALSTTQEPATSPIKKHKRRRPIKKLLVDNLKEGFELLGNGEETVFLSVRRIQVKNNLPLAYSFNFRNKPKYVPIKYWNERYNLFSKYDEGIEMDEESWFRTTHEEIAKIIAEECKNFEVVMDGFAGAGGNVLQFAKFCETLALDIDGHKLEMLRNNAEIYEVGHNIRCIEGDFLTAALEERPDVIFMSPSWGGPDYLKSQRYDLFKNIYPQITSIMNTCNRVTKNIILYLPRTANPNEIAELFKSMQDIEKKLEIQLYCYGSKVKTIGCFMGEMVQIDENQLAEALLSRMEIPKGLPNNFQEACHVLREMISKSGYNESLKELYLNTKPKIKKYWFFR